MAMLDESNSLTCQPALVKQAFWDEGARPAVTALEGLLETVPRAISSLSHSQSVAESLRPLQRLDGILGDPQSLTVFTPATLTLTPGPIECVFL